MISHPLVRHLIFRPDAKRFILKRFTELKLELKYLKLVFKFVRNLFSKKCNFITETYSTYFSESVDILFAVF